VLHKWDVTQSFRARPRPCGRCLVPLAARSAFAFRRVVAPPPPIPPTPLIRRAVRGERHSSARRASCIVAKRGWGGFSVRFALCFDFGALAYYPRAVCGGRAYFALMLVRFSWRRASCAPISRLRATLRGLHSFPLSVFPLYPPTFEPSRAFAA